MDTSRIIINTYDNSTSITESATEITGFTVVKAEKGPCTPIRIAAGGTTARKDIFGSSSKSYPEMFEVETFNSQYDCWISAPYTSATVPAAIICKDTCDCAKELTEGGDTVETPSTTGNCVTVKAVAKNSYLTYTTDMEKEILGLSDSDSSAFDSMANTACACKKTDGTDISVSCDCIKAVIIPKYPSNGKKLHITVTPVSGIDDPNRMTISAWEENSGHTKSNPVTISGSLDPYAKNAGGSYIGFSDLNSDYANQNLFYVHVFNEFEDSVKPVSKTEITLEGGTRKFEEDLYIKCADDAKAEDGVVYYEKGEDGTYTKVTDNSTVDTSGEYYTYSAKDYHYKGWEEVDKSDYTDVNIFFDCRRHTPNSLTSDQFITVAKTHPYQGFIFNETPAEDSDSDISALSALNYGRNCWNVCNEAIIVLDNGDKIISPLVGARAAMQCRIIENRFGGVAPMWLNTNGMGGQLGVSIFKMLHKYSKNALAKLDELNYNPVINDRQYGVMCVGQKTCVSGEATDWSYIGHACSFMTFIREVRDSVMIQQIGKPNNPYYRELRRDQVMRLLSQRLEGNNRIWAEGTVDTSTNDGVNDVYNRKKRCFVINVRVKVDIYSEYVILNFTNEDQATTITVNDSSEN